MTALTPPDREAHRFTYTSTGLPETYAPPSIGTTPTQTRLTYHLLRQVTSLTQPDNSVQTFGYDQLGRTTTITQADGVLRYGYDPATGDLETMTAADGGTITYGYNEQRQPTSMEWQGTIDGLINQIYNSYGQVTEQQVAQQPSIPFVYDPDGTLRQAGALVLHYTPNTGFLHGSTMDLVTDTWTYNGFDEFSGYQAAVDGSPLLDVTYERDALGRITLRRETSGAITTDYRYTYDDVGALTQVEQDGTVIASYAYDANGHRLSVTDSTATISATVDAQDRLLTHGATTYTYTPNGARQSATTAGQQTTYAYDPFNQLRAVTLPDGTTISYVLDAQQRRVGKAVNGELVQAFLYADQLRPIAELDGSGAVVSQFVYGSRLTVPDYLLKDGRRYRIIADHVGSPRLVVDTVTGAVVQRLDLMPGV